MFGRPTTSITAVDDWVTELDRFGLISERAVPWIGSRPSRISRCRSRSRWMTCPNPSVHEVGRLAAEVGLTTEELPFPLPRLAPAAQLRLRVGRALALRPRVLLAEHPNASLSRDESPRFAKDFARITSERGLASLAHDGGCLVRQRRRRSSARGSARYRRPEKNVRACDAGFPDGTKLD